MQPDPNGSAADAPTPDTATAASGAPEQGSTSEAVAVAEDHDEGAATDREPTPESDEDPAEDDGDDEGAESEQTEEQKKLSRRERQRLREQERIERERQAAIEEYKRTQQAEAERAKREAEAQKAREQAAKEFAEYIGEPDEPDRLNTEIAELHRRIRAEIGTLTQEQFDQIEADIRTKEARIADIKKARGFQTKIAESIWNGIEGQLLSVLRHPEFSDPATRQRFLQAEGGIAGALDVMREVVRTAAIAEKDAEIAKLKAEHDSTVKTLREEMRGWRVRAGAEEVPDTTGGGQANGSGTVYTRERLSQMLSTPEGIAEYRRNRAEIERQERAGLIR